MKLLDEIQRLRHKRRSCRPEALHKVLSHAGFDRRSGKGDHWVYTHPKRQHPLTIDPRNPLLPVYVAKALIAIEEVIDEDD